MTMLSTLSVLDEDSVVTCDGEEGSVLCSKKGVALVVLFE